MVAADGSAAEQTQKVQREVDKVLDKIDQGHCSMEIANYRADWEPEAGSRRRVLGVLWRCPAALWGPSRNLGYINELFH